MAGCERIWLGVKKYGWVWKDMAGCEKIWLGVVGCEHIWQVGSGYGRV